MTIGISSISWILLTTTLQNAVSCITTTVNVTTDVYWLVNGVMKYNSMYTWSGYLCFVTYNKFLMAGLFDRKSNDNIAHTKEYFHSLIRQF